MGSEPGPGSNGPDQRYAAMAERLVWVFLALGLFRLLIWLVFRA